MRIVVDASVAVKWVLKEPRTEAALALRDEELIAPTLWLAEAANALWRHVRLGELDRKQALARLSELENAPIASLAIEPHIAKALELATEADHPVYDCIYLALALHRRARVVTDDRRFLAAAARLNLGEHVRLLGG
jgi:predicted nucleic acid-binding protein